jgi:hypothetical protein
MFVHESGWNEQSSNLYTWPSKDASYQVSIHLAKRFQRRRFFFKSANQNQELELSCDTKFSQIFVKTIKTILQELDCWPQTNISLVLSQGILLIWF